MYRVDKDQKIEKLKMESARIELNDKDLYQAYTQ